MRRWTQESFHVNCQVTVMRRTPHNTQRTLPLPAGDGREAEAAGPRSCLSVWDKLARVASLREERDPWLAAHVSGSALRAHFSWSAHDANLSLPPSPVLFLSAFPGPCHFFSSPHPMHACPAGRPLEGLHAFVLHALLVEFCLAELGHCPKASSTSSAHRFSPIDFLLLQSKHAAG